MHAIGLVVALPAEARSLTRQKTDFDSLIRMPDGHWLMVSGAGPERAEAAARRLLQQNVLGLMSWGCAAALAGHLKPGHLMLPDHILDRDGTPHATDPTWRSRIAASLPSGIHHHRGTLVESAEVVTEHAEKQSLRLRTDGVAVDMESAAVARVATAEGIPFSSVRTIADPLNMSFPNAVTIAMNPRGDVRLAVLLGHLVRHPGETGSLIALGRAFGAAVKTLHRVRHAVGDDFRLRSAT